VSSTSRTTFESKTLPESSTISAWTSLGSYANTSYMSPKENSSYFAAYMSPEELASFILTSVSGNLRKTIGDEDC
jgi:hypothetical protein